MVTIRKPKGGLRELETERYILSTLPVLWLPLYRKDGSSFISADGLGHVCTVTGALWGRYGRTLDGDDTINCGDILNPTTSDFAIVCWVKPTALDSANRRIVSKQTGAPVNAYCLRFTDSNAWEFFVYYAGTAVTCGGGTPAIDTWYHVVAQRSGTTVYLYVDNSLIQSTTDASMTNINATGVNVHIGSLDGSDEFSKSVIGEVLFYSGRSLSGSERLRHSQATEWRYK